MTPSNDLPIIQPRKVTDTEYIFPEWSIKSLSLKTWGGSKQCYEGELLTGHKKQKVAFLKLRQRN